MKGQDIPIVRVTDDPDISRRVTDPSRTISLSECARLSLCSMVITAIAMVFVDPTAGWEAIVYGLCGANCLLYIIRHTKILYATLLTEQCPVVQFCWIANSAILAFVVKPLHFYLNVWLPGMGFQLVLCHLSMMLVFVIMSVFDFRGRWSVLSALLFLSHFACICIGVMTWGDKFTLALGMQEFPAILTVLTHLALMVCAQVIVVSYLDELKYRRDSTTKKWELSLTLLFAPLQVVVRTLIKT